MSTLSRSHALLSALSLASLLAGCDPKAASGAIGVTPEKSLAGAPVKPGPDTGGITPTLPPAIDPLLDPVDEPFTLDGMKGTVQGPEGPVPWKLQDPAARGGCRCHLECGPANDDRSKDCITICEGTGC